MPYLEHKLQNSFFKLHNQDDVSTLVCITTDLNDSSLPFSHNRLINLFSMRIISLISDLHLKIVYLVLSGFKLSLFLLNQYVGKILKINNRLSNPPRSSKMNFTRSDQNVSAVPENQKKTVRKRQILRVDKIKQPR